jgi:hypothetical protein
MRWWLGLVAACGESNASVGRVTLRAPVTIEEARDGGCYTDGDLSLDAFDGVALDPLSMWTEYATEPGDATDIAFFDRGEGTRAFFPGVVLEEGGWFEADTDAFRLDPIAIAPAQLSGRLFVDDLGVALRRGVLLGETGRGVGCLLVDAIPDETR